MSSVTAACPKCKQSVTMEEAQSALPTTCSNCRETFIPAQVIAESNKKFEVMMYVGMLVVGVGLIVFMAATGRLKPKADPPAPAATEPEPAPK